MKTNNFIIAVITVFLLALSTNGNAQNRIVGGNATTIAERPYQVKIDVLGSGGGSGVILNSKWIVTAGHVVNNASNSSVLITCGVSRTNTMNAVYTYPKSIIMHPNFRDNGEYCDYDIALIELESPLSFNDSIQPIRMSSSSYYPVGTNATVSGWGSVVPNNYNTTDVLRSVDVTIVGTNNTHIWTNKGFTGPNHGDSGGPLTIGSGNSTSLIGIVSYGYDITYSTNYKYYSNIGYYYNWILNTIYPLTQNHIYGVNLIGRSNTNFDIAYDSPDVSLEIGPGINMVSQSGNNVVFNSMSNGSSYIRLKDHFYTIQNKTVWCGIPVIFGIVYDGRLLRVLANEAAEIDYTEWSIGGSYFSTYDDFIYPSYLPSGTQLVTVRARNGNGYSNYYSEYIDFNNGSSFYMTINANSRLITVMPSEDSVSDGPIEYVVSDIIKGNPVLSGSLPSAGGTIDCSHLKKGTYAIKVMNNQSQLSKKISF